MKKSLAIVVCSLTVAIVLGTTPASALTGEQEAKLVAHDGAPADRFGCSVAVDGDTAVVGAKLHDDNGEDSGSAYVFTRAGGVWTEQAKLLADDGASDDFFGASVTVEGDTALIGALGRTTHRGAVYVFIRVNGTWSQQAILTAADGTSGDRFGHALAVDGDTALIGADGDDDNGSSSGSAYVFTRIDGVWSQRAKLVPGDGSELDNFGWSVAVDGDTAIIGANLDDDNGQNSGSAYIFTRMNDVWSEQAKLVADDGANGDYFGQATTVDGDTALIGAKWDDDNGSNSGSAYVFTRTNGAWTQRAKLTPADAGERDWFGSDVVLMGDTALIGCYWESNGSSSGSVYVFTRAEETWTQQAKLLPDDGQASDRFGYSLAIDGDTAVFGAWGDDDMGNQSGSAYVFRLGPADSDGDGVLDDADVCANTAIPESVPTNHLGVNRWALVDDDGIFDTTPPPGGGGGPNFEFTIQDTGGCSCEQIIDAMALGWGHTKFGCSTGAMLQWIAQVGGYDFGQPEVEATPGGIETLTEDGADPSLTMHGDSGDEPERQRLIRPRNRRQN